MSDDLLSPDERSATDALADAGWLGAPATQHTDTTRFDYFERWCRAVGRTPLPASDEVVAVFLLAHTSTGRWTSYDSVKNSLTAIRRRHQRDRLPTPTTSLLVIGLRKSLRRQLGSVPTRRRTPLRPAQALAAQTATGATSIRGFKGTPESQLRTRAAIQLSAALRVTPGRLVRIDYVALQVTAPGLILPTFAATSGLIPGQSSTVTSAAHPGAVSAVAEWLGYAEHYRLGSAFGWTRSPDDRKGPQPKLQQSVRIAASAAGIEPARQQQTWAWTPTEMERVLECVDPSWKEHRRTGAYMLTGLGLALRDMSLRSVQRESVRPCRKGYKIEVPHYKGDNGILARVVTHTAGHPPTCPACALQRWLDIRGDSPGPLFVSIDRSNLTDRVMLHKTANRGLQALLANAGLHGLWGTHSLRRGFISAAVDASRDPAWIQGVTQHKSIDEILRYFDEAKMHSLPSPLNAPRKPAS